MIETEKQRRWWFATHPEFSWGRKSGGGRGSKIGDPESAPEPDEFDEQTSFWERLIASYGELSPSVEKYFGPQANISNRVMLAQLFGVGRHPFPVFQPGFGGGGFGAPPPPNLMPMISGGSLGTGPIRGIGMRPSISGGGPLGLRPPPARPPAGTGGSSALPKGPEQPTGGGGGAGPGGGEGPGRWVLTGRRGGKSLEHQSKMSGQPIVEINGKFRINEYELNGTKFDNFSVKKWELYEIKGNHSHLFDKNADLKPWVKNPNAMRNQAVKQVRAAKPWGLEVIWQVGKDQVRAFKKLLQRVRGVKVIP